MCFQLCCVVPCGNVVLQEGPITHHLHLLDTAEFNGTNIWSLYEESKHGPPLFDGKNATFFGEGRALSGQRVKPLSPHIHRQQMAADRAHCRLAAL